MTVGLRVRDAATGAVLVEITDRLTRVIGVVNTGTSPGSISVPGMATGLGWGCVQEVPPPNPNIVNRYRFPRITISGTTLSWDFPGTASLPAVACDVIYGVY
jgi:hypothetical protein